MAARSIGTISGGMKDQNDGLKKGTVTKIENDETRRVLRNLIADYDRQIANRECSILKLQECRDAALRLIEAEDKKLESQP